MTAWRDLPAYLRAPGMSNKWIGNDHQPDVWHLSGFNEGAEGVFISGPIKGLVHRPFKSVWHEPAYGAPRFERTIDERKEISTRIAICSDSEYGWQDVESKWWNGCNGDDQGFWCTSTRRTGELWLPMQLADAVQTELSEDPGYSNYIQEWDILLAADGEPRWRMPDLQPPDFVSKLVPSELTPGTYIGNPVVTRVRRDEEFGAPMIDVAVGKLRDLVDGARGADLGAGIARGLHHHGVLGEMAALGVGVYGVAVQRRLQGNTVLHTGLLFANWQNDVT